MKAVILEIKGGKAAVLSEDGRISRISNKNYTIGQQIIMRNNSYVKLAATAAAAVLLFATPAWAYLTPYSYVSLDVNPSFEFSINRFDRVIEVKAVNGDAEPIVEEISIEGLKNKEIKEAVKAVLTELKDRGYIAEGEDGGVVVATSSKSEEKNNKLAETLKSVVDEEVKVKENKKAEESAKPENTEKSEKTDKPANNSSGPIKDLGVKPAEDEENEEAEDSKKSKGVEVEVVKVTQQKVNEAKEKGVTPGKMNLVDKLEEVSDQEDFNEDEWLKKPVKEIMDATKEYEKAAKEENKEIKEQEKNQSNTDSKTESGSSAEKKTESKESSGTDSSKGNKKN
ncbi:MAG: hypothetical protein AAGU76_14010 [Sedimentibacter sp.]|uniref:anti-sigma-I factor RsgI family protein n=1 Tax=Sedimentibacter sp. TaxID=1960295 RepID=UPI003158DB2E